jgi:hypothetical protein
VHGKAVDDYWALTVEAGKIKVFGEKTAGLSLAVYYRQGILKSAQGNFF